MRNSGLKRWDARVTQFFDRLLLKPLNFIFSFLRTEYAFDHQVLIVKRPFRRPFSQRIDELDEIGVQTTDQGPFIEDVFWLLKRGQMRIRIGDPHPVFKELMDGFSALEDFDWELFANAMCCTENRYFVCWKRKSA